MKPADVRGRCGGGRAEPGPGPRRQRPPALGGRRGAGSRYSLDEVAGALLREPLLPSAGQVCKARGAGKEKERAGRRGENSGGAPRPRGGGRGGGAAPSAAGTHLSGSCGRS